MNDIKEYFPARDNIEAFRVVTIAFELSNERIILHDESDRNWRMYGPGKIKISEAQIDLGARRCANAQQ